MCGETNTGTREKKNKADNNMCLRNKSGNIIKSRQILEENEMNVLRKVVGIT